MRTLQLNHAISGWKRLPALLLCAAALLSVQSLPASAQQPDDPVATRRVPPTGSTVSSKRRSSRTRRHVRLPARRVCAVVAHRARRVPRRRVQRIETLDGKPRKLLRHNDELCVRARAQAVRGRAQTRDSFPARRERRSRDVRLRREVARQGPRGRDRRAGRRTRAEGCVPLHVQAVGRRAGCCCARRRSMRTITCSSRSRSRNCRRRRKRQRPRSRPACNAERLDGRAAAGRDGRHGSAGLAARPERGRFPEDS